MPTFLVYHIPTKALLKFSTVDPLTKPFFDHTPVRRRFETDFFIIVDQMTEGSSTEGATSPLFFSGLLRLTYRNVP